MRKKSFMFHLQRQIMRRNDDICSIKAILELSFNSLQNGKWMIIKIGRKLLKSILPSESPQKIADSSPYAHRRINRNFLAALRFIHEYRTPKSSDKSLCWKNYSNSILIPFLWKFLLMYTIRHGYYAPYFYWMFPLVVANEEGIFKKEGIDFRVTDIVASGQPENKADWYFEAFQKGVRDFYFCCAWQGVYSTNATRKGRIVAAAPSTIVKTFAIYALPDSEVKSVFDIGEHRYPVAVNKFADAHYVTLKNLRQFLPDSQIKLAHLGGVEQCFKALLDGKVKAATLAGPYADFAYHIGMRRGLGLSRDEPTFIVMDETFDKEKISAFLKAVNMAIARIRQDPERYRDRFYKEFDMV